MKKVLRLIIVSLTLVCLTGCGGSYMSDRAIPSSAVNGTGLAMSKSYADESYYVTGGDYSKTYIEGDKVDYSYNFTAGGETNKNKSEMLADYEHIQNFVIERNGFMDSVYNDYNYYDLDDYMAKEYVYNGQLSFTIEIDNEYVDETLAELEQICKDNKFTVTTYSQTIHNYANTRVISDEDYYSGNNYEYNTISQSELDNRLQYADIAVHLNYYRERSGIVKFGLTVKEILGDLWEAAGAFVTVIIVLLTALLVLFLELKAFYKSFKKTQYHFRQKHPEYYPPQGVYVVSQQGIEPMVKEEPKAEPKIEEKTE